MKGYRTLIVSALKFTIAAIGIILQYLDMLGLDNFSFAVSMILFKLAELAIETIMRFLTTTPFGQSE